MKILTYMLFISSLPLLAQDLIHQAAAEHDFYGVRAELWNNVSANKKSKDGRAAKDYLQGGKKNYTAINLMLRCYAFCESQGVPAKRPKIRHDLAVISDGSLDYKNKTWGHLYLVNEKEKNGKAGVDDDGNGFIDDIYGWNFADDTPLRRPMDKILSFPRAEKFTKESLIEFAAILSGDQKEDEANLMENRYENPLVYDIGFTNFQEAGADLDDRFYASLCYEASHGTHVAGIIHKLSQGEVKLHGTVFAHFAAPKQKTHRKLEYLETLAQKSKSYADFIIAWRKKLLQDGTQLGLRRSRYFEQLAPGVVNMSWGGSLEYYREMAREIQDIYMNHGMNPKSFNAYVCPIGLDLCDDLAIELMAAEASEMALTFYRNPDTLFVIAAGNASEDNDLEFCNPAYFARFFPNVITVAAVEESTNADGVNVYALADFSNYGFHSVQVSAPGVGIDSTLIANAHGKMDGTSMAAPYVTGVAARIRKHFPHLTAADVRRILERSVTQAFPHKKLVSTSGVVNAEAAFAMAKNWKPSMRSLLGAEVAGLKSVNDPAPDLGANAAPHPLAPVAQNDRPITCLAGNANGWAIITGGKGKRAAEQTLLLPEKEFSSAQFVKKSKEGYTLIDLAGGQGGWAQLYAKEKKPPMQRIRGLDFDASVIADDMKEGFHIQTIAGGMGGKWITIMNHNGEKIKQRFTYPRKFDAVMDQWIYTRWNEGHFITSLDGYGDKWVTVMTKGTPMHDQQYIQSKNWPARWINGLIHQGYHISLVGGTDGQWVVVMNQTDESPSQRIKVSKEFPTNWIKHEWGK